MSKSTVARAVKTGEDETPETDSLTLRESEESAYCLNTETTTIWEDWDKKDRPCVPRICMRRENGYRNPAGRRLLDDIASYV